MKQIEWTKEKLKEFKEVYFMTTKMGYDSFIFEDNEFLVAYAKYLIEYLEGIIKKDS